MKLNEHIHYVETPLLGDIPVRVFIVKGDDYSVLIDTGIASMFGEIERGLQDSGAANGLRFLINTHSHHDHIGCNHQVKTRYNPILLAPKRYLAWQEDFETHIAEFARSFPELIPETPELRQEVLNPLDQPAKVDGAYSEGFQLRPGGGVVLTAYAFPGHMEEEYGFVEEKTRTLLLGDAVTLLDVPLFHGHLDVPGYRSTIRKLRTIVSEQQIETILTGHFPIMRPEPFMRLLDDADCYLDNIEAALLVMLRTGPRSLEALWHSLCDSFGKIHEFRSLSMVAAHMEDLLARGLVERKSNSNWSWVSTGS